MKQLNDAGLFLYVATAKHFAEGDRRAEGKCHRCKEVILVEEVLESKPTLEVNKMGAKSFADKLKKDASEPDLAKITWDADRDNYRITLFRQTTVVTTIAGLEALQTEIERVMTEVSA